MIFKKYRLNYGSVKSSIDITLWHFMHEQMIASLYSRQELLSKIANSTLKVLSGEMDLAKIRLIW